MSDDNRANDNDSADPADEDRLPWLEAVEEDGDGGGPSVVKLVAAILIGLVAIGVIVGGLYWLGNRSPGGNGNDLIVAEQGDYKQRPENQGGMNLAGEGNVSVAASEGEQPRGSLNLNNVAEQPGRPGQPQPAATAPSTQPARPAPAPQQPQAQQPQRPAPAPAPSGPAIQLGAFSTPAAANSAWNALAGRFRYLAPLSHNVVSVQAGGRTLHRLRASGPDSANICRRLQAAGEACAIVN